MPRKPPKKIRRTFNVNPQTYKEARHKSKITGINLSFVVESALKSWAGIPVPETKK